MASIEIDKKKVLGRGLASLIPEAHGVKAPTPIKKEYFLCEIERIVPNTYQPRKIFEKEAMDELVDSVKVHGVIQPLVARHKDDQQCGQ
jgi:ParB family chromosome partitioning protein